MWQAYDSYKFIISNIIFSFKVSPLNKLTFIFASFFLTSLNIHFQTFCYSIYITFLLYNFPNNSFLLKFFSFSISNFSCSLTSALNLSSNFVTTSFTFSESFSLSYILFSTVNFFHHIRSLLLLLFLFYLKFSLSSILQYLLLQ